MKKITLAALSLAFIASTSAFAETTEGGTGGGTGGGKDGEYTIGDVGPEKPTADPATFTYKAKAGRAGFVKNDFEFTVSANSAIMSVENETRAMAVGAVSTRGRNLFTGHSDGGSVAQCGPSLAKADADEDGKLLALLDDKNILATGTAVNGCGRTSTSG